MLLLQPRRGLKKSIRDGLPVIIYNEKLTTTSSSSTSATVLMDNQCVVCLGDYQKNETLQQLPVCSHIFHKACVDEWLANNSTCPLCRMSLLVFPTQKNSNNIIMKSSSSSSSPPQPSSQLQQLPRLISNRNSAAAHEERISTFPTPSTI
jgi:E3 ubiquitin-protein ligase ATL7/58/59